MTPQKDSGIRWAIYAFLVMGLCGCQSRPRWHEVTASHSYPRESMQLASHERRETLDSSPSPVTPDRGSEELTSAQEGAVDSSIARTESKDPPLRPEQFSQRLPNRRQLRTDKSDPAIFKQLALVGRDLAEHAPSREITFEFLPLHNQQPRVHHTEDGQIYVTTGLLERVTDKNELAAILAIEMAEALSERETSDVAMAAAEGWTNRQATGDTIDRLASRILSQAGYPATELSAARAKVLSWTRPVQKSVTFPAGRQLAN